MYYGRSYPMSQHDWWFCVSDEKIYGSDEMVELFGFSNEADILKSKTYIKLFKTDILALEHQFLKSYHHPELNKRINALSTQKKINFNIAFNICTETDPFHADWVSFEKKQLETDAVLWCCANGLPYIN